MKLTLLGLAMIFLFAFPPTNDFLFHLLGPIVTPLMVIILPFLSAASAVGKASPVEDRLGEYTALGTYFFTKGIKW